MNAEIISPGNRLIALLKDNIERADETIALAALVTDSGVQHILPSLTAAKKRGKHIKFIFGTNMPNPSSPKAIRDLFKLHDDELFQLRCYSGDAFFHPKLFLFNKGSKWSALIGSSNLSDAGFNENIEFNCWLSGFKASDPVFKALHKGLGEIEEDSDNISSIWIDDYEKRCAKIAKSYKGLKKQAKKIQQQIKTVQSVELAQWNAILKRVKSFKGTEKYKKRLNEIKPQTKKCRQAVGKVTAPKVNRARWENRDVGYFTNLDARSYAKTIPTTRNKLKKLNAALKHLLNKHIPLEERLGDVLYTWGKFHIKGMGISHVSDILNKYYPEDCIILNNPIVVTLNTYGVRHFSSDPVRRYMAARSIYKKLREEAHYPKKYGYALLDRLLWGIGHRKQYGWS